MLAKMKTAVKKVLDRMVLAYQKREKKRFFEIKAERSYRAYLAKHSVPELSQNDKDEIVAYWKQYGITVKNFKGFQWYYGVTGMHDPRFISHDIYADILVHYLNKMNYVEAYRDKAFFNRFLPDIRFPATILKTVGGRFYGPDDRFVSADEAKQILKKCSSEGRDVIAKNSSSGGGKQVKKWALASEADADKIWDQISNSKNWVVQEVIQQHPFFAQFNESSVNILRINTLYLNGKVVILDNTLLRYGQPGRHTDIYYVRGEKIANVIGITKDGRLMDKSVDDYAFWKDCNELFDLSMTQVPAWEEVKKTVIKGAEQLPYFNLIGWDVTVDADSNPVVLEYNVFRPACANAQFFGPFFGEYTEEVLSFLKDKENQKKYIPDFYAQ